SQRPPHIGTKTAAADLNQPLTVIRMLVDELHGHAAAERLTDDRRPRYSQLVEQVTEPHRERSERVVAAGLVGLTMSQKVGRDDAVFPRQLGDHCAPCFGAPGHSVDQEQYVIAAAEIAIRDAITVKFQVLHFVHGGSPYDLIRVTGFPIVALPNHRLSSDPETGTGRARWVGSRVVRRGEWRRCCRAAHRGSGP